MKIEELPHIKIKRNIPNMDCMADSYSLISKVLDKDCVVAYYTDNSQTTFLIKTSRQYVSFICISDKLSRYIASNSTNRLTRMKTWNDDKDRFIEYSDDEDLIIVDKDKWDKYLKIKLLDSLGK